MSEIKVNKVSPRTACGTVQLGDSGDTITIPAGATITNNGTQTGFGRSGAVNWQTTAKTSTFTAVNGEGYFVDTSSGAVTANVPAGSAGAIVSFADYTRTFGTNNLTISPNGTNKIGGIANDAKLKIDGQAATFVYVDATEGWVNVQETQASQTGIVEFLSATGGTVTCSGDFKVHTFTGPGTFAVSAISTACVARNEVSYMVVAGGGGGAGQSGGGGGGGGFRESKSSLDTYSPASPLEGSTDVSVTVANFPITVGAGGTGGNEQGGVGGTSTFSTINSAGGGGGKFYNTGPAPLADGGSGGGGGSTSGSGNTPPVSPPQGSNGGTGPAGPPNYTVGGGGGATETGQGAQSTTVSGRGGAGATTSITGSASSFSGGGGGGTLFGGTAGAASPCGTGSAAGAGGGNNVGAPVAANSGGGAGGRSYQSFATPAQGTAGGSGIVVIRYKFQ